MTKYAFALILLVTLLAGCAQPDMAQESERSGDQDAASAYQEQESGVQLTGVGIVTRILEDDSDGARHQRFILALSSGQTLLIAHNIDVAPRLASLRTGDSVEFSGVYEWNDEGGVVHWTHHDPDGVHQPGWLKHGGKVYQ